MALNPSRCSSGDKVRAVALLNSDSFNDIDLNAGEADMWKYVDDTTISEVVDKG